MREQIKKDYTNCEILAPAGSYQCMVAAFNAGADAVYVGGSMFGARAYANNFDKEELISAIEYAHLRNKRLYLTVNTLLKSQELEKGLYEYLKPLYEAGLDAVIVQDMGVVRFVRRNFKNLAVHASTQMTVTGVNFAKELKELGVDRIVTARELSYKEIRNIYDATGLEIESFVHGALCYSYSGQCLLSSMIGGRSGNRGRCAQPCRLNYGLYNEKGQINDKNSSCILSPKDMCTLNILPEILKSGVYSLKIEGRMKKPEYVATVVSTYRKYIDILKNGDVYNVKEEDIDTLREIYNRGGFTTGFYTKQNGKDMMSVYKPNHYGVKVMEIISVGKNVIRAKALKDIEADDVLEVNLNNGISKSVELKRKIKKSETVEFKNVYKELYEPYVYRTRNNKLIERIEQEYINKENKVKISGFMKAHKDEPMEIAAWFSLYDENMDERYIHATVTGEKPEKASNRPADEKSIRKQILKTGATDFEFENLDIRMDNDLFIPVSKLNEMRRELLEKLRENACDVFKRELIGIQKNEDSFVTQETKSHETFECVVSKNCQLEVVLEKEYVDRIALEISRFSYEELAENIDKIHKSKKEAYLALPYICRKVATDEFERMKEFYVNALYDGVICRNLEEFTYFCSLYKKYDIKKKFIFDSNIYTFNKESAAYYRELAKKCGEDVVLSVPYELNKKETDMINPAGMRMEVYGYIPVMISAGCVKKTTGKCDKTTGDNYYLTDRLNNKMPVITNCRYCYNLILNGVPIYLGNDIETLKEQKIGSYSIRFTIEDVKQTEKIMDRIEKRSDGKNDFTRGHFRRGVM